MCHRLGEAQNYRVIFTIATMKSWLLPEQKSFWNFAEMRVWH
jgi:hypothetical protein